MANKDFWKGRKVAVTGAAGFVGSYVVNELIGRKAKVFGLFRGSTSKAAKLKKLGCVPVRLDLVQRAKVENFFRNSRPDTVLHFAGQSIVSRAILDPLQTYSDNVDATLNLLNAARLNGTERIVIASSDKVYGDHAKKEQEPLPFQEGYGLRGLDIYSSSKASADILSQAFAYQYKMKIAIARACNIYGPGDVNLNRLIPKTSMLLLSGQSPEIRQGHERVLREYLYIEDAVSAYLLLAEKLDEFYGRDFKNMPSQGYSTVGWPAFNIGSYDTPQLKNIKACENIKSVNQVVGELKKFLGGPEARIVKYTPQHIEIPDEYSDSSKLLSLGFTSQVSFREGIERTVKWYRAFKSELFANKKS
jgi:CDP-glucose 4,6-dehydratase